MFIDNFHRYVFEEHGRRRRDDRASLGLSLLFSAFMLACGSATQTAALGGLVFLIACVTLSTAYYCFSFKIPVKALRFRVKEDSGVLYRPVSRRAALISLSAAAVVVATITEAPEVGAAIVDRRLRRFAASVPLDLKSLDEVGITIDEATRYKLKLSPERLRDVARTVERTSHTTPALSAKAMMIGAKIASASTLNIQPPKDMQGKVSSSLPEAIGARWEMFGIASNIGPDNYETVGIAASPDIAEMWHVGKAIPPAKYGPGYLVVKGLKATLDGFYLKHVLFQDMSLIYHGGPLILEEVYFINCDFQIDPGVESWSLISSLISGGWVSFSHVNE